LTEAAKSSSFSHTIGWDTAAQLTIASTWEHFEKKSPRPSPVTAGQKRGRLSVDVPKRKVLIKGMLGKGHGRGCGEDFGDQPRGSFFEPRPTLCAGSVAHQDPPYTPSRGYPAT